MADLATTLLGKNKYVKVVSLLFNLRTNAHIAHLQARGVGSLGLHLALDNLYKELPEIADRFAESSQKDTILTGYTLGELFTGDFINFLNSKYNELVALKPQFTEGHLQQIIDDATELISGTMYKMKFLQ